MAISQTNLRSISLPSRLQSTDFESDLQKLKSFEVCANSEAIQSGLLRIAQLYTCVEEISESHQNDVKSMEESLSASVELLDGCSAIREVFQMMKENIQTLESALRRKGMDSRNVQTCIDAYFCCRKRMSKCIAKALKNLKKSEQTTRNNGDSAFRELTRITMAIFKSILIFLSSRSLSLVSKLMNRGENDDGVVSEVVNVELGLMSLQKVRSIDGTRILDVQKRLQNLEDIVEGFDGGLERMFRQLVQIRVSLLNILTNH